VKNQLHIMANTNDFELCQQYLMNYMETIKTQLNQYQIELNKQQQSCSIKDLRIDQIDICLHKFVNCQRKYLTIRNNSDLTKFKDNISANDLFQSVSIHQLTTEQVRLYEFLMKYLRI
jgi:hypothetical protein